MEIYIIAEKIDLSLVQYRQARKRSTQIWTIDFFNGTKQFNGERRVLTINDAGGNWTFTSPNKQTHTSKPHTVYKFNTMGIISLNL